MKKIMLGLFLLFMSGLTFAQNGLENIIVEKYYISNAADATGSVGTLPAGSVTYRFYVDMLPGYKFQAAYGNPSHTLRFTTTTSFFNNEDRGAVTPTFTKTQAAANTVILDSYISAGAAAANNFGVLKSEDDNVSNINFSGTTLQNADPLAGIAPKISDGLVSGSPSAVSTVGQTDAQAAAALDATSQAGNSFTLTDGAWSSLAGALGPLASNRILIAQITTDGILTYELNIQVGTPTGGVQRFVASNPTGSEITLTSLSGTLGPNQAPSVSITAPANNATFITGTTVNITANASDSDGSVASVQFFVDGVSVGTDNLSPYEATYTAVLGNHVITAVATDNEGATKTSTAVNISVQNNPPPTVSITAPTNGASIIVGDVVNIAANASDNGSVASVQFFVDGVSVGTDNNSPYEATYTATLGAHVITARATDDLGAQTTSTAVNINVVNNLPPLVSITSPSASTLFTAPQVVSIAATASDPDGTVSNVQFFVNNVLVGSDNISPYSFDWTSVVGTASITVKATDNRGEITTSNPVVLNIADPNALPYTLATLVEPCNNDIFSLPIIAADTVENVIGYDITVNFDKTKVFPTGTIAKTNDLCPGQWVEIASSINPTAGTINLSVYFNGNAPGTAKFSGLGDLLSIEFSKLAAFSSEDTSIFSASLQESRFTGVSGKLVDDGAYISYKDSTFSSSLKLWKDNSPIRYNAANPNQYLVTNIKGANGSCVTDAANFRPDTLGNFEYNINKGLNISIEKNILGNTDVQAVINGADALLGRRVITNDASFIPSSYQIIALDVNLDGIVSAGDISQINQRAVLQIPEFKQAWNYNPNGVSNGQPSKDWLFVNASRVSSDAAFTISATYPLNDNVGFSKSRVPSVNFCVPVSVSNASVCPQYTADNYVGVLLGDVNGNVATANPSNLFKRQAEAGTVIFNLNNAVYSANSVEIPVSVLSAEVINSVDFSMQMDESKLMVNSVSKNNAALDALVYFNQDDKTLRFTSNSLNAIDQSNSFASVKFTLKNGKVNADDFKNAAGYINGEPAAVEFVGQATGINTADYANVVSVFPVPANESVFVLSPESAMVQLMNVNGQVISAPVAVQAGQAQQISVNELAAGVYFVRIANDDFSVVKRIVVNK